MLLFPRDARFRVSWPYSGPYGDPFFPSFIYIMPFHSSRSPYIEHYNTFRISKELNCNKFFCAD